MSSVKYFQSTQKKVGSTHTNSPQQILDVFGSEENKLNELSTFRKVIVKGRSFDWSTLSVTSKEAIINGRTSHKSGLLKTNCLKPEKKKKKKNSQETNGTRLEFLNSKTTRPKEREPKTKQQYTHKKNSHFS